MTDRDFKLLTRDIRNKQKRIRLNKDFFPSKQFQEMEDAELKVDKELEDFTRRDVNELPFKTK